LRLSSLYSGNLVSVKGETMLSPRILRGLIFLFWLVTAPAIVQAQNSRASSAASYLERGNEWLAKAEVGDCDRALKLDARHAQARNNRGLARQEKGDLDGALSDFDCAIALDPQQAAFYGNRGKAWLLKREVERAMRDLNRALSLDPKL